MSEQSASPLDDSNHAQFRNHSRFPPDKPETWVIVNGERKAATIVDESFEGIGITMDTADGAHVQAGDYLLVLHYDYATRGRVQWIQRDPAAKQMRLGIRWAT